MVATFNVSDVNFVAGEGLQIFFEYGLYEDIQLDSGPANFDFKLWDPGETFAHSYNGLVDALAQSPTTDNFSFTVSYNWLGGGISGTGGFNFELYDENQKFNVTGSGRASSSAVPVPGAALLGSGV